MSGSLGKSDSSSSSGSSYNTDVWSGQSDALQQLYQNALDLYNQTSNVGSTTDTTNQAVSDASDVYGSASDAYNYLLSGGAYGDTSGVMDQLLNSMGGTSNMGQMYESIVGGSGNEYVDPLIESLQSDAAQNVATLQNSNSLDAADAGQSGSSRQAMQNAMITSQANQDLLSQEAALRQGNYDTDTAMKMAIAQQADTNAQSEQDRLLSIIQGSQDSAENALSTSELMQQLTSGGLANLISGQTATYNPLSIIASIIGSPTLTSSGESSSDSSAKGLGLAGGLF